MSYCPHCGYRHETTQTNDVCDDCYDAMAHCQPPTRRPIYGDLVTNGMNERRLIGYYDVNSGEITPKNMDEAKPKFHGHNLVTSALEWNAWRLGYKPPTHDTQGLIAWAATFPDAELLTWRKIGPKSIAWIRSEAAA